MGIKTKLLMLAGLSLATVLCYTTASGNESKVSANGASTATAATAVNTGIKPVDSGLSTFSFDKGTTRAKLGSSTKTIAITNQNGSLQIKQGNVKEMEIHTTVVVNHATKQEASAVANKCTLQVKQGEVLSISTYGERYGQNNSNSPSIDLVITLPQQTKADLNADLGNGNLVLSKIASIGRIKLTSVNGNIIANEVSGDMTLQTKNGSIHVSDAVKSVSAVVTNGAIETDRIAGPLDIRTTNGNLIVKDAASTIKAAVVSGGINVTSNKVGGNWDVSSTLGNVTLSWPENAAVKVDATASLGDIQSDFALTVKEHHATGTIGKGTYKIGASTDVGQISFKKNR